MDGWKSMLFGSKPAGRPAVKWLGMGPSNDDAGRSSDRMFVAEEAATEVLQPLGEQQINLISIFGAARQGKSFLMNLLADQQDLFKISNLREPCTQGVDLSGHFISLEAFSSLNGCPAVAQNKQLQIGFVDAEGQGDRDITYDSRLVSPVLLSSKTVIFNWKDTLQADRMLNLLAVLARAAQGIELADGDNAKVFGHLHIIFRDWSFVDSTPDDVYNDLFAREKGRSDEVNVRNLARTNLVDAFESITIWLFPAPVANTATLRDKIRFDQLQRPFQEKLRELRKVLSSQLQTPMEFNRQPLTARLLVQLMPALVETLNSDQVIMPESIYSSMVRAEAKVVKDECERSIAAYCEAAGVEDVASASDFERNLRNDIALMIAEASESLAATPAGVRAEMEAALDAFAQKEIRIAVHAMNEKVTEQLLTHVDAIFASLQRECTVMEQSLLPMRHETLMKKCRELLKHELARLHAIPTTAQMTHRVDAEARRIEQHATTLFDKLEVVNEKAVQKLNSVVAERTREAKLEMTAEAHAIIDKRFHVKRPVLVAALQAELEDLYVRITRRVLTDAGVSTALVSDEYQAELDLHKTHLADELNRRYLIEMRQILNEVGYAARDDLTKEVAFRLDGKLPLLEDEIKSAIDAAIEHVKVTVSEQLQGWTVLKTDIEAKSMELEKLGDVLTDDYLRRNHELMKVEDEKKLSEQYDALRANLTAAFVRDVQTAGFPTTDDKIDSVFYKHLQTLVAQFLSFATSSSSHTPTSLRESLTRDCSSAIENQKMLNRLAIEKTHALELAEQERKMREQEALAAREKEAQMHELKTRVERSLDEKDSESKRLRDELRAQGERARRLEEQMRAMQQQSEQSARAKQELEAQAQQQQLRDTQAREREAALLKQQLDEMKRRADEMEHAKATLELRMQQEAAQKDEALQMRLEIEAMKRKNDEMAAEKLQLELRALEEAARREEAVQAARAAAAAAAVSARAAIDAAAHEDEDDDVEMADVSPVRSTAAKGPSKKRRVPTKAKTTPDKGPKTSLEEARKAARDEVERRIQERAKSLIASKKK